MELTQSEETIKLIMNSALDAIICMDSSGVITTWTRQAEKLFGWNEEEVKGKILSEIIIPVRYRERHKSGMKHYLETHDSKVLNKIMEIEGLHRNGKEFPVELTIVSIKQNGTEFFCAFLRDISERKKVEEELRESELRYRSLVEHAGDAIFLVSDDTSFIDVNTSACKLLGYTREELLRMKILEVYSSDELEKRPLQWDILQKNKAFLSERKLKRKDGTEVEVEINSKVLDDKGYLAIIRDITERKRNEERIVKSEQKYRALIEQASDPIMVTDFKGNFVDVNTSLCNTFGYTKEELLKLNIVSLIDPLQLDARPIKFDILATGQQIFSERRMRKRDGSFIEVEANVKKVDDNYVMAIARDVTQLRLVQREIKISEARFRGAFEFSAIGMAITTLEGKWIKVNRELCLITGYSEKELLDLSYEEITHPDDLPKDLHYIRKTLSGKIDSFHTEKRYYHKSGAIVWVNLAVSLVRDPLGEPLYFVAQIENISERKKSREALVKKTNELKERVKELRCLYSISEISNSSEGSTEEILQKCVNIIPPAYQYPEITCARITFQKKIFQTELFLETHMKQETEILIHEKSLGKIEVFYMEERPKEQEGPFLKEERWLINSIVKVISTSIERKKAEEEIRQSQNVLRELSAHLETIREEERTSIAREIHDELGQQLTGLKMDLSSLVRKISSENDNAHKKAASMMALLDMTMKTVRHISSELRPGILDDLGLVDAINWHGIEFEKRTGVRCQFKSKLKKRVFEKDLSTGIFRVYQETLTNVARHANATKVSTTLETTNDNMILKVQDNGKGFDEAEVKNKNTLGLVGMKERAIMFGGKITIETELGKGTIVTLQVPLKIGPRQIALKK